MYSTTKKASKWFLRVSLIVSGFQNRIFATFFERHAVCDPFTESRRHQSTNVQSTGRHTVFCSTR
jgi:hypothetical protein